MALSKKAKTWLIILSIPVVLLVVGAIALKLYFTDERLKSLLIPRLESATGRKITVSDVSLSVFPSIGVDIRGLTIANKPGFSEKPMVSLERMLADVKLRPLFSRRLEISSLLLEKPQVLLETDEHGITNYSDKVKIPDTTIISSAEAGSPSNLAAILFSDLRITNGFIELTDRQDDSKQTYNGFHVQATGDFNSSTNQARIESKVAIDNFSYGSLTTPLITDWRINTEANLVYDAAKKLATIENGKAFLNAIPMDVGGTIDMRDKPDMDITIEAKNLNVAQLLNLTPKAYVEQIKGVQGNGNVEAKILIKGIYDGDRRILPTISGNINTNNATIQYPNIAKPITNISIISDFIRGNEKKEFHIRKLSANLGQNPISVTMDLIDFDAPTIKAIVLASMNLGEVKDYYPLDPGTTLAGKMKANVSVDGKVSNPDAMKSAGSLEFQGVTIATATSKNPIKNMNGILTFNNQNLETKKLLMTIGRSDLALAFTMRNYLSLMSDKKGAPKASASVTLNSNHLYTADIMGDDKASGGKQSTAAKATSSDAPAGGTQPAKSAGKSVVPLPNMDMTVNAVIGTLTTEKLEMKNVRGALRISNGAVVDMQNITMNMFDGAVATKGSLDFKNMQRPTFNLNLDMKNLKANKALSTFTSFGQRLFGDLDMDIVISGALDDTMGLIPSSLNATGKAAINNGKLTGVKVNEQIASLVHLPDISEINFKDWVNAFSIKDGRVVIPDLKIAALGADYTVNGSQGLDGTMDFKMAVLLSEALSAKASIPGFAGEILTSLKEPSGRLKLDFLVGGTADNLNVQLDLKALQARAADFLKQKLDAETKKKTDDLKSKGTNLLKDLFKKKK